MSKRIAFEIVAFPGKMSGIEQAVRSNGGSIVAKPDAANVGGAVMIVNVSSRNLRALSHQIEEAGGVSFLTPHI